MAQSEKASSSIADSPKIAPELPGQTGDFPPSMARSNTPLPSSVPAREGCEVPYAPEAPSAPERREPPSGPQTTLGGAKDGAQSPSHLSATPAAPVAEIPSEVLAAQELLAQLAATEAQRDAQKAALRDALRDALMAALSPRQVSERQTDRRSYARDLWPLQLLRSLHHQPPPLPELVVWPETEAQVIAVVTLARQFRMPLTPFGGGSGVLGGAMPSPNGLVMDLKRMDFVGQVDIANGTVTVGPGVLGWHLEEKLRAQGFTLGHFPSSLMTATVGGYVATRSAGQFSSRYGKIEDMVVSLRFVSGTSEVFDTASLSPHDGPELAQILLGSEGTLGVITAVQLRVHRAPATARYRGVRFHTLEQGLLAMRLIMQAGLRPSVLRLYDELDTFLVGRGDKPLSEKAEKPEKSEKTVHEPVDTLSHARAQEDNHAGGGSLKDRLKTGARSLLDRFPQVTRSAVRMALGRPALLEAAVDRFLPHDLLLILGTEGEPEEVDATMTTLQALCLKAGGQDLGTEPGERWLAKRYDVSFKMPTFFYHGAFVDTVEVAATWEHIPALYHAVRQAVADQVMIMAHFSHAYPEGLSIYFSLGGSAESLETAELRYHAAWKKAMAVVHQAGGTVSHHHGVGQMKAAQVMEEQGAFVERWQHLKRHLDPDGILNPGKLFPLSAEELAPRLT